MSYCGTLDLFRARTEANQRHSIRPFLHSTREAPAQTLAPRPSTHKNFELGRRIRSNCGAGLGAKVAFPASARGQPGYLVASNKHLGNTLSLNDLRNSVQPVYDRAKSSSKHSTVRLGTSAQLTREKSLRSTKSSFFRTTATAGFSRGPNTLLQIDRKKLHVNFGKEKPALFTRPQKRQAECAGSPKEQGDRSRILDRHQPELQVSGEGSPIAPFQTKKKPAAREAKEYVNEIHPLMLGEPLVFEDRLLIKQSTLVDDRRRPPLGKDRLPKRQATGGSASDQPRRPRVRVTTPSKREDSSRTSRNSPDINRKGDSPPFRLFEVRTRRARKYQVKLDACGAESRPDFLAEQPPARQPAEAAPALSRKPEENEAGFELCGKVHKALKELYAMYPTKQEKTKIIKLLNEFIFEDINTNSKLRDVFLGSHGKKLKQLEEVLDYHIFQYVVDDASNHILHDMNGLQAFQEAASKDRPPATTFQFLELIDPGARAKRQELNLSFDYSVIKKMSSYPVNDSRLQEVSRFYSRLLAHVIEQKRERNRAVAGTIKEKLESIKYFRQLANTQNSKKARSIKIAVVKLTNPLTDDSLVKQLSATIGPHRNLLSKVREFEEKYHQKVVLDEQYSRINRNACETMNQLTSTARNKTHY